MGEVVPEQRSIQTELLDVGPREDPQDQGERGESQVEGQRLAGLLEEVEREKRRGKQERGRGHGQARRVPGIEPAEQIGP